MAIENIKKNYTSEKPIIVIVDDDIAFLNKLQGVLSHDFTVLTTAGGIEALRFIKRLSPIHVLVITNDMTQISGAEILRFVHESIPRADSIIKILITNSKDEDRKIESTKVGTVDAFLKKPVSPHYVKRKIAYLMSRQAKEKRSAMRIRIKDAALVRDNGELNTEIKLDNISENGMFMRTLDLIPNGSTQPFKLQLPNKKEYSIQGRIVRTASQTGGVGVEFISMDEESRISLMQSLADSVTLKDLVKLKARYPFLKTEDMVLFSDSSKIDTLLNKAKESGTEIVALPAHSSAHETLKMTELRSSVYCSLRGDDLNIKFKTSDLIFVSFQLGYATYSFETMVYRLSLDGQNMDCLYPQVLFYSDKRYEKRINPLGDMRIEIPMPAPFNQSIQGIITDISPGGVSFVAEREMPLLLKGTPLEKIFILDGNNLLWEENGEVRHATSEGVLQPGHIRYGIQFGIARMGIQAVSAPEINPGPEIAGLENPELATHLSRRKEDLTELVCKPPEVIRIENRQGEEIVGLLNTSFPLDGKPIPVVLIPPAFGKTKETLFTLAETLIENFHYIGKPVAVIRYDGIRRKGESYKDPEYAEPPYELVNADFTQGARDIKTIMDWLETNPVLRASSTILISFSLSALEARIVLRDEAYRNRISYWISCMGTPEFRELMTRINCGLDFLEHFKLGIKMGIMPVLGNLVNVDHYVSDGVENEVATLDQAREDIGHYDIPITWIYGEHDKWVKAEFIRDIMSVKSDAPREVIPVSIGHNARTSAEALKLFGTITSLTHRFLFQKMIQPFFPSKKNMEGMRRAEKDRLPPRNLKNRKNYWRRYLVGEDNFLGFDIMGMSDDYQELMQEQYQALQLNSEDRLLDLGGGTGIFIDHMIKNSTSLPAYITIADLIPEAMRQAYKKFSTHIQNRRVQDRLELLCLDLEMSRFLPVRRFLNGEIASFQELADMIENLNLESAIKIQKSYSPRLHRILRGQVITPDIDEWLKSQFDVTEYRIIVDFNQAAGYLNSTIAEPTAFQKLMFPKSLEDTFHLPVKSGKFNKILMSLVLSYIFNPAETLFEVRRIIKPGGRLVLSSMRPDTDASGLFTRLMSKIESMPSEAIPSGWSKPRLLESLRLFLNDAQALVDLEEAGTFDFFDPEKLKNLLEETGWNIVRTIPTFGNPPQGYIVIATAREIDG